MQEPETFTIQYEQVMEGGSATVERPLSDEDIARFRKSDLDVFLNPCLSGYSVDSDGNILGIHFQHRDGCPHRGDPYLTVYVGGRLVKSQHHYDAELRTWTEPDFDSRPPSF
jgi:hypothetical protein